MQVTVSEQQLPIDIDRVDADTEQVQHKLQRYLQGERVSFDEAVELSDCTEFQQAVLNAIRDVSYGETITYSELAERIGQPDATCASQSSPTAMTCSSTNRLPVRAAANACGCNPVPIIIPCHRVVSKNGLGGYAYGTRVKEALLELERENTEQ